MYERSLKRGKAVGVEVREGAALDMLGRNNRALSEGSSEVLITSLPSQRITFAFLLLIDHWEKKVRNLGVGSETVTIISPDSGCTGGKNCRW